MSIEGFETIQGTQRYNYNALDNKPSLFQMFRNSGAPTPSKTSGAKNGDMYWDTTNYELYICCNTTLNQWAKIGSFKED